MVLVDGNERYIPTARMHFKWYATKLNMMKWNNRWTTVRHWNCWHWLDDLNGLYLECGTNVILEMQSKFCRLMTKTNTNLIVSDMVIYSSKNCKILLLPISRWLLTGMMKLCRNCTKSIPTNNKLNGFKTQLNQFICLLML